MYLSDLVLTEQQAKDKQKKIPALDRERGCASKNADALLLFFRFGDQPIPKIPKRPPVNQKNQGDGNRKEDVKNRRAIHIFHFGSHAKSEQDDAHHKTCRNSPFLLRAFFIQRIKYIAQKEIRSLVRQKNGSIKQD